MGYLIGFLASVVLLIPVASTAVQAGPNDVYVRVFDVGPGKCVVAKIPGGFHLVFDGGH